MCKDCLNFHTWETLICVPSIQPADARLGGVVHGDGEYRSAIYTSGFP